MSSTSLFVVRGSFRGIDPNFACAAHSGRSGLYAAVEVADGSVVSRTLTSDRAQVEEMIKDPKFAGVYLDRRTTKGLLPAIEDRHCQTLDFASFRQAKSDEEMTSLESLYSQAYRGATQSVDSQSFRGAVAQNDDTKAVFETHKHRGFVQYRGGLRDSKGRVAVVSHIAPNTPEWEARQKRVYRGLDAVLDQLSVGATQEMLETTFRGYLHASDHVHGPIVHHTGFEDRETTTLPFRKAELYDTLKVEADVSDGREVARIFRGFRALRVEPPETREKASPEEPQYAGSPPPAHHKYDQSTLDMYESLKAQGLIE